MSQYPSTLPTCPPLDNNNPYLFYNIPPPLELSNIVIPIQPQYYNPQQETIYGQPSYYPQQYYLTQNPYYTYNYIPTQNIENPLSQQPIPPSKPKKKQNDCCVLL